MTIELRLTQDQERLLMAGAAEKDVQIVRQILVQAVDSTVEDLIRHLPPTPSVDFESLSEELNERLAALVPSEGLPLSDRAASRAGIYDDHP